MKSSISPSIRLSSVAVTLLLLHCTLVTWAGGAGAAGWPQWRGPNRDGISEETDWDPRALSGSLKMLWHVDIGGGHSNVAIAGGRLFTMGKTRDGECVLCLDADTGKVIWQNPVHDTGTGWTPQATPSFDGKYVYALSYDGILLCLKANSGKLVWRTDLINDCEAPRPGYGFGTSPAAQGDLVVINAKDAGIALDKRTGEVIWEGELIDSSVERPENYATPVFYDHDGRRCVVIFNEMGLIALDLDTGEQFWFYGWMKRHSANAADPVLFDGKVFVSSSEANSRGGVLDISGAEPELVWENRDMTNHFNSCVYMDGYLYGVDGNYYANIAKCTLRCVDAGTGELMWQEPTGGASLTAADGRLIVLTVKGTLHIAEATPDAYNEISSCQLPAERGIPKWWTPPVLCGGRIYCRNFAGDLVCVDVGR